MEIVEYQEKYLEDVRDLLVELEEYIVNIDKDKLDTIHEEYREKMALVDLEEVADNNGKTFLAIENNEVIGLIMGIVRKWDKYDYLDYKCPKTGIITELIVSKSCRKSGIGNELIKKMEQYFKSINCEYILVDVFGYNENAINFYTKNDYHTRMLTMIKKIDK
ncbi:MAG: GNAT family N-acetyltransferase [Clostridiales bacterium]|nr:GNAT family N-acetyltransferase [Clostridiales bacterium]